jgi:hypothetical protein
LRLNFAVEDENKWSLQTLHLLYWIVFNETDAIMLEKNTCGTNPCKLCSSKNSLFQLPLNAMFHVLRVTMIPIIDIKAARFRSIFSSYALLVHLLYLDFVWQKVFPDLKTIIAFRGNWNKEFLEEDGKLCTAILCQLERKVWRNVEMAYFERKCVHQICFP